MFNNSLISDFVLSDNIPQYQNKTWSGEVITRIVGTQYFSISFKVTTNKKYRTDLTNFLALYSSGRPFDMSLGWWGDYSGNQATGVQVTAARTAGATSIQTNTNNLSPGDLIQFSGHKKLYRVIARSGTTLNIYPGLIRNLQIGETVKYDNLMGSFILTPANSTYDLPSTNIIEMTITATENIRG